MKAKKITEEEMIPLRIASLPTRPTAPVGFGGKGYTAAEMKAAFDLLPNLIAERYNDLISDVESGEILEKIPVEGRSLAETIADLSAAVQELRAALGGEK